MENVKKDHQGIRIFENPFLEALTHVHPIVPLLVWVPIIFMLFYTNYTTYAPTVAVMCLWSLIGLVVWTLSEYVLHRFVFHFPAKSKAGKYFVYLFHGLHHDDPKDGTRLVMPPVPALLIVALLYLFFSIFIPAESMGIFMGFFLIGYLIYDYIHYATHHFPMTGTMARALKSYHLKHHFAGEDSKYGVSSPLWDYIFKSVDGPKSQK